MTDHEVDRTRRGDDESGWFAVIWQIVRGLLLTIGVVVLGSGIVIVLVPEAEELLPIDEAIAVLGSDYIVIAALGLLAVGLSTPVIVARHVRGVRESNPPVVEGVQSASYPGETFDEPAGNILSRRSGRASDRRDRLRDAAIRATMRAEGCTRTAATQKVAEGAWTDDSVAGEYLSDGKRFERVPRRPRSERRMIRRTVEEIEQLTDDRSRSRRRNKRPGYSEEMNQ